MYLVGAIIPYDIIIFHLKLLPGSFFQSYPQLCCQPYFPYIVFNLYPRHDFKVCVARYLVGSVEPLLNRDECI